MTALVHAHFRTVGNKTPRYVHCMHEKCDGRAKRTPEGRYRCQLSYGGCGSVFELTQFDVPFDNPKLTGGQWVLKGWKPGENLEGVWIYETK